MKTKGFGKLIALVLCMAMAFSVSSTAFAAEPSSNVEAGNGAAIVSVDNTLAGVSTSDPIYDNSITLGAHEYTKLPLGTLTAGQTVTVIVDWEYNKDGITTTPSLIIGMPVSTATSFDSYELTGTDPMALTFPVSTTASYSLFFANPSSSYALDVNFTVIIIV